MPTDPGACGEEIREREEEEGGRRRKEKRSACIQLNLHLIHRYTSLLVSTWMRYCESFRQDFFQKKGVKHAKRQALLTHAQHILRTTKAFHDPLERPLPSLSVKSDFLKKQCSLLGTSASLLVTSALLVVTRSY